MRVLQSGGTNSRLALPSILISALTCGFTSATISFDFDISTDYRRDDPDFYGYVPGEEGGARAREYGFLSRSFSATSERRLFLRQPFLGRALGATSSLANRSLEPLVLGRVPRSQPSRPPTP